MDKKAVWLKTLRIDVCIIAILMTLLAILRFYNLDIVTQIKDISTYYRKVIPAITLIIQTISVLLLSINCIGAWMLVFGKSSGTNAIKFVSNFFKVLAYIGIVIMGLIAIIVVISAISNDVGIGSIISVLFPEIVVAGLLYFIVYFCKLTVNYADDIQGRMTLDTHTSTSIAGSPIGAILVLLAIINLAPSVFTYMAIFGDGGIFISLIQDVIEFVVRPIRAAEVLIARSMTGHDVISDMIEDLLYSSISNFLVSIISSIIMLYGAILTRRYGKKVLLQNL